MSSEYLRGLAFLYNVSHDRPGCNFDYDRMHRICREILGISDDRIYDWQSVVDEVDNDEDEPNPLWAQRFSEVDYVLVFHGSHGLVDGRVVDEQGTVMEMRAQYLEVLFQYESLNGKLKWVLLQACRGSTAYHVDGISFDGDEVARYPKYFLVTFPTHEGHVSSRQTEGSCDYENGSIYLRFLEDALREQWRTHGLLQILDEVNERARRENPTERPSYSINFCGDFYFRRNQPGHLE